MSRQYSTGSGQGPHRADDTVMDDVEDIPRSPKWQHDHHDQVRVDSHGRPIKEKSSGQLAARFNAALRLSESDPIRTASRGTVNPGRPSSETAPNQQDSKPFRDTRPYMERTVYIKTQPRKFEDMLRYAGEDYDYAFWLWDFLGYGKPERAGCINGGWDIPDVDGPCGTADEGFSQSSTARAGPSQSRRRSYRRLMSPTRTAPSQSRRRSYRRSSETGEEIEVIEVAPRDRDSRRDGRYR